MIAKIYLSGISYVIALAAVFGLVSSLADAEEAPTVPTYVEEISNSGLASIYQGEWQYMVGGGVAAFDCNGDGYPDLALAGGEGVASLYVNKSERGGALRFAKKRAVLSSRMSPAFIRSILMATGSWILSYYVLVKLFSCAERARANLNGPMSCGNSMAAMRGGRHFRQHGKKVINGPL